MPRRKKPNFLPLLLILTAGVLLSAVLLLAGYLIWDYWQGLPAWGQVVFAAAVVVGLAGLIGVPVFWVLYRRRQRAAAWSRAMAAWQNTPKPTQPYQAVRRLSPRELEQFAAQVYAQMGYQVAHTGRSGDHGVDVRLVNPAGETEIVQCKQWKQPVGEPDVRNLVGSMVHENAVRGYLWAPGGFTPEAQRWARGKPVVLVDDREIARMVISNYQQN